jgi:hypothetical protein
LGGGVDMGVGVGGFPILIFQLFIFQFDGLVIFLHFIFILLSLFRYAFVPFLYAPFSFIF